MKHLTEVALAAKSYTLANFRNGIIAVRQHALSLSDSQTRQIRAEWLTHGCLEESHEMRSAHGAHLCGILHFDQLRELPIKKSKEGL